MVARAVYRVISIGSRKGKTRVGTALVRQLTLLGVNVAVVKHTTHAIDQEGKDTYLYSESGASVVVLASARGGLALMHPRERDDLRYVVSMLPPRCFVVVAEGYKSSSYGKKVMVVGDESELRELLKAPGEGLAIVAKDASLAATGVALPVVSPDDAERLARLVYEDAVNLATSMLPGRDCGMCGLGGCREFAEEVVRGTRLISECPVTSEVELQVDGISVPLNPYVKRVFSEVLRGLVSTLKDVPRDYRSLKLVIRFDRDLNGSRTGG